MQISDLKVFCDVVRFRSFSLGASENQVSQSAASQTVHHMENHLGVALIDRSHRPWKLTSEGKLFYEGCREITERYLTLESKIRQFHEEVGSVLHISSIFSVGLRHMSKYVNTFSKLYPQTRVHLEYLHPDKVYESVQNEKADLGIVSFPKARRGISVIAWKSEPMTLTCSPEHRFANLKKITPADLSGEKFVAFDKELVIRKEIDRFLKKNNIEADIVMEFDTIEAIKRAVEIGSGVSILPQPTLDHEIETGTLKAVSLWTDKLARPLGIIHRKGKKFHPNLSRFIELLQDEKIIPFPGAPRPNIQFQTNS